MSKRNPPAITRTQSDPAPVAATQPKRKTPPPLPPRGGSKKKPGGSSAIGITEEGCLSASEGLLSIVSETSERLSKIAEEKKDEYSQEVAERASKLRTNVGAIHERVTSKLAEGKGDLTDIMEDISETTAKVLENGKLMQEKLSQMEDGPQKQQMSETTKIMLMVVAGLFLMHFGVSPEIISLAGIGFKMLTDRNDQRPITSKVSDLTRDILTNNALAIDMQKKAFGKLASYAPVMAKLGLDADSTREALTSPNAPEELFQKARALIEKLPSRDQAPGTIKAKIQRRLKEKIEEKLGDNPELATKFSSALEETMREQGSDLLRSITNSQDTPDSASIMQKAKDLAKFSGSINDTIDKFYAKAQEGGLSAAEKVRLNEIRDDMRSYVAQTYERPLRSFCAIAKEKGTTALAQRLSVTSSQVSALSTDMERIFGAQSSSRART